MTTTTLITGAFGYIGGRLANGLRGDRNLRLFVRRRREDWPAWAEDFDVVQGDMLDQAALATACRGVDEVIHLAALNAQACFADPLSAIRVNIEGTQKLATAAREAGVGRILYMSTVQIYGRPLVGTVSENRLPRPGNPYGWTHRAAEDIVLSLPDIEAVVLRLSNVLGPPADPLADCWTLVTNDLCRQAVEQGRAVLRGTGLEKRDVLSLGDMIRTVKHFLALPHGAWGNGIFNVGGARTISMRALAGLIATRCAAVLGTEPTVSHQPGTTVPPSLVYDIAKLRATGFQLVGDVEPEIDATLSACAKWWRRTRP